MRVRGQKGYPVDPVVLVTGASSGIGRETALLHARRGAGLALAARSTPDLDRVASECAAAGARDVLTVPADVAQRDQVECLLRSTLTQFGTLDIVVHCASVTAFGRFGDVPPDVFDAVIETNLCGSANVARCALEWFSGQGGGQLVLVGSMLGQTAMPYQSPYVVSKFGINGLVRLLRQETRDRPGVSVHGIYPGPVDTPIYRRAANYYGYEARAMYPTYSPARTAAAIVHATDRGRSGEHNVTWVSGPLLAAYRLLPALFDTMVGPFLRTAGFTSGPIPSTSGNVFSSAEVQTCATADGSSCTRSGAAQSVATAPEVSHPVSGPAEE
jgi:NAD(P)-dependent dehydrogenase (short-subunit alcohol dehydrogenase family)